MHEITLLDRGLLLITGLIALYLVSFFLKLKSSTKSSYPLYYAVSFGVLLVAGLLLIGLGYGILANPLVVIVSALIPLTLSLGVVAQLYPAQEKSYLGFVVVGLAAIAVTRFVGPAGLATAVLAIVHSVAGLIIFFAPLSASSKGAVDRSFAWVTVGGALIGIGGIALAMLKAGKPILSANVIFTILAPLLLLMAGSFAYGFVKGLGTSKKA